MTLGIFRAEEKHETIWGLQAHIDRILRHPIWDTLWSECKKEKVIDLKMVIKRIIVSFMRFERKWGVK